MPFRGVCRCATGEAWQLVMMSCVDSPQVKCDAQSEDSGRLSCGSDFAYPYFVSFYAICSFLVSATLHYTSTVKESFLNTGNRRK